MLFTPNLWVPLVVIQNTYILPGIPRLFQTMVQAHAERFKGPAALTHVLYSNLGEGEEEGKEQRKGGGQEGRAVGCC